MGQKHPTKKATRGILGVLVIIGLLLVLWRSYDYIENKNKLEEAAKIQSHNEAISTANEIDARLRQLMAITQQLANQLSNGSMTESELQASLMQTLIENKDIFGLGVAYVPYGFKASRRLYAPYYARIGGEIKTYEEGSIYDYTQVDWYKSCVEKGATWLEPYYGQLTGELQVKYSVPFYRTNPSSGQRELAGVVYINHSLQYIKDMMDYLKLGKTGYGYIISGQGKLIAYPIAEYVGARKTIFDLAEAQKIPAIIEMGKKQIKGEKGFCEYKNEVTGQNSWVFYEPIPSAGWSVGTVFITDEVFADTTRLKRALIQIDLLILLFLLPTFILFFGAYEGQEKPLWLTSLSFSVLLMISISFIWYLTLHYPENHQDTIIVDKSGLDQFVNRQTKYMEELHKENPIYIPTGIFIQSLQILGSNDLAVTGYIWQKYTKDNRDNISQGVIFPEAISQDDKIEESYRRVEGNTEIVGWYFNIILRQNFSYAKYPFDRKDISIRLWHKDFDKNVILIPDLKAYRITSPEAVPGLEKNLVLSGFKLESSYFSFGSNSYNTNFGINKYVGQKDFPELCFKIRLSREFQDPFISNVLPVIVISWILFASLIIITKEKNISYIGEFSFSSLLASCAGLFFSVLLAHVNLRSQFPVKEILYLEYFFLALYVVILVIVLNAFLFAANKSLHVIHYKDHLIPKLLYWPVLLLFLLGVTVWKFY